MASHAGSPCPIVSKGTLLWFAISQKIMKPDYYLAKACGFLKCSYITRSVLLYYILIFWSDIIELLKGNPAICTSVAWPWENYAR